MGALAPTAPGKSAPMQEILDVNHYNENRICEEWLLEAMLTWTRKLCYSKDDRAMRSRAIYDTIRYDTIEEINVDSKAEYTA